MSYAFFWVIPRRLNYPEESIQHSEHGGSLKLRQVFQMLNIQNKGCSQSRYITHLPEAHSETRIKLLTITDDSHKKQN
jgi:hypothetical protein